MRRLIREGKVRAKKLGRLYQIAVEDLPDRPK
jgi:hypothetical protein